MLLGFISRVVGVTNVNPLCRAARPIPEASGL